MTGSVWAPGPANILTSKLVLQVALSDMITALVAGTGLGYFRVYAPFRATAFYASLFTVSSSGVPTVDINVNGVSILSTKLTIDVNEKNSADAAVPYVISGGASYYDFAVGQEVSFDLDVAGTGAKGLIVYALGFDT